MAKVERRHPSQMNFLTPENAELLHKARFALAELISLYEARQVKRVEDAPQIKSPRDAYEFLRLEMEDLDQEQLRVINLNTKNRILSAQMIYQGTLNQTSIRAAEVFRPGIIDNAACIIVCHNHPSGDPTPSPEDVALTRELVKIGKALDMEVVDHIIIGRGKFVSLKERNLGFNG